MFASLQLSEAQAPLCGNPVIASPLTPAPLGEQGPSRTAGREIEATSAHASAPETTLCGLRGVHKCQRVLPGKDLGMGLTSVMVSAWP